LPAPIYTLIRRFYKVNFICHCEKSFTEGLRGNLWNGGEIASSFHRRTRNDTYVMGFLNMDSRIRDMEGGLTNYLQRTCNLYPAG